LTKFCIFGQLFPTKRFSDCQKFKGGEAILLTDYLGLYGAGTFELADEEQEEIYEVQTTKTFYYKDAYRATQMN